MFGTVSMILFQTVSATDSLLLRVRRPQWLAQMCARRDTRRHGIPLQARAVPLHLVLVPRFGRLMTLPGSGLVPFLWMITGRRPGIPCLRLQFILGFARLAIRAEIFTEAMMYLRRTAGALVPR